MKEGIIPVFRQGIKDIEAMLLDISVLANTGLTHVLIINSQISLIKPHLVQLKLNLKNIEFILSNRILPLTLETLNEACPPKLRSREDRFSEVKAINHDKTIAIDQISEYLKEEAHKGNLLHEVPDLIEKFRNSLKTSSDSVIKLIKTAEKKNVIHLILREFGDVVLEYASLKIEDLSLEILV